MGSQFIPNRCSHIDSVSSNVLIRGNMPLVGSNSDFAYDEIKKASRIDNLDELFFLDIPIIDNVGEREQFSSIIRAFRENPDDYPVSLWPWWNQKDYKPNLIRGKCLATREKEKPGGFIWRPFEGLPINGDANLFLGSPGWDYSGFVNLIIQLMKIRKNTAIYVHCQLGADRTGAFHVGYTMKTQGVSLQEAILIANSSTSSGSPNSDYKRLVEVYSKNL